MAKKTIKKSINKSTRCTSGRRGKNNRYELRKEKMGVVYIDLEYTNGNYYMCDIIETAAVSERTDATYHTLVKIEDRIPPNVTKLTGITDAALQAVGIPFPDAFNGLIEFIRTESTWDPTIISHGGIATDFQLIVTNCMKHGIGYQYLKRCTFIDSVQAFQNQGYEKPGLDELCRISNILSENRHDALEDAGIIKTLHGMYNTIPIHLHIKPAGTQATTSNKGAQRCIRRR